MLRRSDSHDSIHGSVVFLPMPDDCQTPSLTSPQSLRTQISPVSSPGWSPGVRSAAQVSAATGSSPSQQPTTPSSGASSGEVCLGGGHPGSSRAEHHRGSMEPGGAVEDERQPSDERRGSAARRQVFGVQRQYGATPPLGRAVRWCQAHLSAADEGSKIITKWASQPPVWAEQGIMEHVGFSVALHRRCVHRNEVVGHGSQCRVRQTEWEVVQRQRSPWQLRDMNSASDDVVCRLKTPLAFVFLWVKEES